MTIHIEFVEDVQGDVVDTKVYCNSTCAYFNDKAEAYPTGYESDTCVYCANDGCNSVVITELNVSLVCNTTTVWHMPKNMPICLALFGVTDDDGSNRRNIDRE